MINSKSSSIADEFDRVLGFLQYIIHVFYPFLSLQTHTKMISSKSGSSARAVPAHTELLLKRLIVVRRHKK
jgi:hypothetical protein